MLSLLSGIFYICPLNSFLYYFFTHTQMIYDPVRNN